LFYVALTRAMQRVTLSYAGSRYRWGVPVNGVPSRFIREIDPEYLDQPLTAGSATNLSPAYDPDAGSTGWRAGTGKTFYRGEGREKTRPGPVEPAAGRLQGKTRVERARPAMPEDDFKADDPAEIQPGMEVEHPRFGTGKVLNLEGPGANRKATVFFREHGQKQLLLKFARLKIIR